MRAATTAAERTLRGARAKRMRTDSTLAGDCRRRRRCRRRCPPPSWRNTRTVLYDFPVCVCACVRRVLAHTADRRVAWTAVARGAIYISTRRQSSGRRRRRRRRCNRSRQNNEPGAARKTWAGGI